MIKPIMPTYNRVNISFERGEGCYLYDIAGRRYLDFAAGIAVDSLGHCHPHLVNKLQRQVGKLWHTSNLYRIPSQEKLAERLIENTFADAAFFTNSGAEAIECSLKAARRYHNLNGAPEKYRIICFENAFHGRTLATIAAGGQSKLLAGFGPVVEGFDHVALENLEQLRDAITPEIAAILVEPIQGEGGIRVLSEDYLKGIRLIADEFNILLIYDEVQCGMGRTGKLFAHEWIGVAPDIMAIAKGLGGGFPVGACLATEAVGSVMTPGTHGSTFGGNPLAMEAANAVMDIVMEDGFLERVEEISKYFHKKLLQLIGKYPGVFAELRGQGLMVGLKCAQEGENSKMNKKLTELGMLSVVAGDNVLRLVPPLIVSEVEVDEAVGMIERVAVEIEIRRRG